MFANLFKNETLQKKILETFADKLRKDGIKQVLITLEDNGEINLLNVSNKTLLVELQSVDIVVNEARYDYLLNFFTLNKNLLNG